MEIDELGLSASSVGHNYALSACRQGKRWKHGFEIMAVMKDRQCGFWRSNRVPVRIREDQVCHLLEMVAAQGMSNSSPPLTSLTRSKCPKMIKHHCPGSPPFRYRRFPPAFVGKMEKNTTEQPAARLFPACFAWRRKASSRTSVWRWIWKPKRVALIRRHLRNPAPDLCHHQITFGRGGVVGMVGMVWIWDGSCASSWLEEMEHANKALKIHQKNYGLDEKLPLEGIFEGLSCQGVFGFLFFWVMQPRCCFCHSLPSLQFWLRKNEIGVWNATSLFAHMVTRGFGWIPARNWNLSNILGHVGKNWSTHLKSKKDNLERFLIVHIYSSLIMPTAEVSFFWYKTHIAIFLSHLYIHLIPLGRDRWLVAEHTASWKLQQKGQEGESTNKRFQMSCIFWLVEKLFSNLQASRESFCRFLQTWWVCQKLPQILNAGFILFGRLLRKGFECQIQLGWGCPGTESSTTCSLEDLEDPLENEPPNQDSAENEPWPDTDSESEWQRCDKVYEPWRPPRLMFLNHGAMTGPGTMPYLGSMEAPIFQAPAPTSEGQSRPKGPRSKGKRPMMPAVDLQPKDFTKIRTPSNDVEDVKANMHTVNAVVPVGRLRWINQGGLACRPDIIA